MEEAHHSFLFHNFFTTAINNYQLQKTIPILYQDVVKVSKHLNSNQVIYYEIKHLTTKKGEEVLNFSDV